MILQAQEEISAMLSSLSPKAAKAFTLAVICEMTVDEVDAEMGMPGRIVHKCVAQAMLGCISLHACRTVLYLLHRISRKTSMYGS